MNIAIDINQRRELIRREILAEAGFFYDDDHPYNIRTSAWPIHDAGYKSRHEFDLVVEARLVTDLAFQPTVYDAPEQQGEADNGSN
jgi:hypothetical protein